MGPLSSCLSLSFFFSVFLSQTLFIDFSFSFPFFWLLRYRNVYLQLTTPHKPAKGALSALFPFLSFLFCFCVWSPSCALLYAPPRPAPLSFLALAPRLPSAVRPSALTLVYFRLPSPNVACVRALVMESAVYTILSHTPTSFRDFRD